MMIGTILLAAGLGAAIPCDLAMDKWDLGGSFGRPSGKVKATADGWTYAENGYRVDTTVRTDANGVSSRKSVLKNVSDRPITARCLMDRFFFHGGEWEVYAQANSWQQESRGGWAPLVACAGARGPFMRSGDAATPMLAIWNRQEGRGRVFHLLTDGAWEMLAYRKPGGGEFEMVGVDVGYDARHLDYELKPGEEIAFPEVIYYDFANKTDFDCHKLHAYWNARHPATRPQPVIYNTWLARFDHIDADFLLKQVPKAKTVGADYFVIDAGWFGPKASWGSVRGDWVELPDGWLGGRMAEISKAVRAAGMKFGFWVEAECAAPGAKVLKEHPDWFFKVRGAYYLDFRNPAAFNGLADTVTALLKKYDASFLKFDYNQSAWADPSGRGFIDYNAAYRRFVAEIRRRNPGVYVEGCASGGYMMNLGWAETFDSFWLSDNQSPYHGVRIVKETMVRLAPRQIERWITARALSNIQPDSGCGPDHRILASDDGTWCNARTISAASLDGFTMGGPYCFSCDLTAFEDRDLAHFAKVIAERRKDADFWNRAVGRILCDTPTFTVFQYDDGALGDVRIVAIPNRPVQQSIAVHPVLTPGADYQVGDKTMTAAELAEKGVVLKTNGTYSRDDAALFVTLRRK